MSDDTELPSRPGYAEDGTNIPIITNFIKVKFTDTDVFQYHITYDPPVDSKFLRSVLRPPLPLFTLLYLLKLYRNYLSSGKNSGINQNNTLFCTPSLIPEVYIIIPLDTSSQSRDQLITEPGGLTVLFSTPPSSYPLNLAISRVSKKILVRIHIAINCYILLYCMMSSQNLDNLSVSTLQQYTLLLLYYNTQSHHLHCITIVLLFAVSGEDIAMRYTLTKTISIEKCIPLLNIIFRTVLSKLRYTRMGRNLYDPGRSVHIPKHKLELWPG